MDDEVLRVEIENLKRSFADFKASDSRTHVEIFSRLRTLENQIAIDGERFRSIHDDLCSLKEQNAQIINTISDLSKKPAKRWENAVTTFISGLIGVVAGIFGQKIFGGM